MTKKRKKKSEKAESQWRAIKPSRTNNRSNGTDTHNWLNQMIEQQQEEEGVIYSSENSFFLEQHKIKL